VKFHYLADVGSTNTYARQLAEVGAREGEVVIAETQTQGRGRLGRHWHSPPFANLYLSVILRPNLSPAHAPQITLMAAVAVAETVSAFVPSGPAIKWPNDILLDGKKLAGILAEAACGAGRVEHVILGIGVNLNGPVNSMPEEIRGRATALAEVTGKTVEREGFCRRLIQTLDRCYGELEQSGFEALASRWSTYFALRDQPVRVESLDPILYGRARGIDREGALLVEDDSGVLHRVIAGDVIPLKPDITNHAFGH
jgi:BirA family biotin operon repressor/biotin-[acetyl-CoA-carboxylase] ligase